MKNLLATIILALASMSVYAQNDSNKKDKPQYKLGLSYGDSFYEGGEEGTTLGIDLVAPLHNSWQMSGFFEKNYQDQESANKHTHIGITIGQKLTFFDKFELSYGLGLGFISRQYEEWTSSLTGETLFGLQSYNHYSRIDNHKGMTIPLTFNLDYKINEQFSAGIITRTAYHEKQRFGTVNISVGYHF